MVYQHFFYGTSAADFSYNWCMIHGLFNENSIGEVFIKESV